jgi:hypothetical protein
MTDHDTPTVAPPPPAVTIQPPPDYDVLVESPLCAADLPPNPHAGLAEMVRNILAEILAEDAPHTQQSRR